MHAYNKTTLKLVQFDQYDELDIKAAIEPKTLKHKNDYSMSEFHNSEPLRL